MFVKVEVDGAGESLWRFRGRFNANIWRIGTSHFERSEGLLLFGQFFLLSTSQHALQFELQMEVLLNENLISI